MKVAPQVTTPALVTLAACTAFLIFRNQRLFLSPELWAEDIEVYFIDNRLLGWEALLKPYNGFVQFGCRAVAWIAGFADPIYAPRVYACFFLASILATCLVVYTSPVFSGWAKGLAVAALFAAPVSSEVFYGMCYMQWVMGPLLGLALCEKPATAGRETIMASLYVLIGVSAPFVLIAAPLVALKAITERSRFSFALVAATIVAGIVHSAPIVQRFTASSASGPVHFKLEALASISYQWLSGAQPASLVGAAVIGVLSAGLFAWYLVANREGNIPAILYFAGFGLALLTVSVWSIGAERLNQFGYGGRYYYIPAVLLLWTAIAIEQHLARARQFAILGCGVLGALFLAHTDRAGDHFVDTKWPATVTCLKTENECAALINPPFLGRRSIPTDIFVKWSIPPERLAFQRKGASPL